MGFFRTKVLLWPILLTVVGLAAGGVLLAPMAVHAASAGSLLGISSETRNTQIINSITRQDQVVLLSLGIQGISERSDSSSFFGADVPGSQRVSFIQYTFDAKLGIDGEDVRITQTGKDEFLVSIPEIIFIGHDNEEFRLIAENNGVLSWVTPEIDSVEMINNILDDTAQDEYIEGNVEILRDQARAFYTGIIRSIDPEIVVDFEFVP